MAAADFVVGPLARVLRSRRRAEGMALSYTGPDGNRVVYTGPDGNRVVRGGRATDGNTWALAAWAEIMGLEPVITHRPRQGAPRKVLTRPWRHGKTSAWAYLEEAAKDKLFGAPARQALADLSKRGLDTPG